MADKSNPIEGLVSFVIMGFLYWLIFVAIGGNFEATERTLKETFNAQNKLHTSLLVAFNGPGKFEVRADSTVRIYIPERQYLRVSYPDRKKVLSAIGKVWCDDKEVSGAFMPKVVFRDISTGKELATYGCATGWVSFM